VPRRLESTPGPYARAVASVINQLIQSRNISMNGLSQLVGKSNNYVGMRLRHQASFTLTDIEDIGRVLGFDPREFLTGIHTNTISQ
jgi:cyanate lyase